MTYTPPTFVDKEDGGTQHLDAATLNAMTAAIVAAGSAGSSGLTPTAVKTANYTAVASDLVRVDTTSGAVTVTLPAAASGVTIGVKLVTLGGSNAVTIAAAGSDVFNKAGGSATLTLTLLNQGVVLVAISGVWVVQADDLALSQLDSRFIATTAKGVASGVASLDSSALVPQAQVPASLRGLGGPNYNITPDAFKQWRKQLSRLREAQALGTAGVFAKALVIADSTGTGQGGTDYRTSWSAQLARLLNSSYVPAQAHNTWGRRGGLTGGVDTRLTLGTGWTTGAGGNEGGTQGLLAQAASGAAGSLDFAPVGTIDKVDLYYVKNSGHGTVNVRDGATSIGSINANNASLATGKVTLSLASRGAGKTISIDGPAGGVFFPIFIDAYDSQTPEVHVSTAAVGATKVNDWITNYATGNIFQKSWLDDVLPHLVMLSLTINDMTGAGGNSLPVTPEATWQTRTISLINTIKAKGADVLLVAGPPSGVSVTGYDAALLAAYRAGLYSICDSENVGLVDTIGRFTDYATGNAAGYYADTLHLTGFGYADMAQAVFNALKTL